MIKTCCSIWRDEIRVVYQFLTEHANAKDENNAGNSYNQKSCLPSRHSKCIYIKKLLLLQIFKQNNVLFTQTLYFENKGIK